MYYVEGVFDGGIMYYVIGVFDEGVIQSPEVMESVMDFISTDSPFSDQDTEFVASPEASSVDDEENIPLKVLILLTDEVFDMKNRYTYYTGTFTARLLLVFCARIRQLVRC